MKLFLVKCGNFSFGINVKDIFKILSKESVNLNNGKINYKGYTFSDLTSYFKKIIIDNYQENYYVCHSDDNSQTALSIESIEEIIEAETMHFYPLPNDIFKYQKPLFKYLYFDPRKDRGYLILDFKNLEEIVKEKI